MWLFGGAFGVGGKKRGQLRYRHENVLKKTSRYKMFRILAIFGVCGILYIGFGTVKTVPYRVCCNRWQIFVAHPPP